MRAIQSSVDNVFRAQAHKRMQRGQMGRAGMGQEMNIMRNMHKRKTARRSDDRYYGNLSLPVLLARSSASALNMRLTSGLVMRGRKGLPVPAKFCQGRVLSAGRSDRTLSDKEWCKV